VTEYGNLLTFATVRGAAHMVPYSQPSRALHLFSSFVRGRRLPNTTHSSIDDWRKTLKGVVAKKWHRKWEKRLFLYKFLVIVWKRKGKLTKKKLYSVAFTFFIWY